MSEKEVDFQKEVPVTLDPDDVSHVQVNEKVVFLALFRRLSNADFVTLLKLFTLYSNCVISYVGGPCLKRLTCRVYIPE